MSLRLVETKREEGEPESFGGNIATFCTRLGTRINSSNPQNALNWAVVQRRTMTRKHALGILTHVGSLIQDASGARPHTMTSGLVDNEGLHHISISDKTMAEAHYGKGPFPKNVAYIIRLFEKDRKKQVTEGLYAITNDGLIMQSESARSPSFSAADIDACKQLSEAVMKFNNFVSEQSTNISPLPPTA